MRKKNLVCDSRNRSLSKISVLVVLSGFLSACSILPQEEQALAPPLVEPAKLEYETAEVTKGEIIKRVKGTGDLVPLENQSLYYEKDGGRLKDILVNEGEEVKKGQTLVEIETGNLAFDIQQAGLDLQKAKLRLQQIQEQGADKYSVEIAKLDVESLELRLYQLNKQSSESKIVSPMNGIVTYVSELKQGEVVGAYQPIIQVADTSKLQILYTALGAEDLADVKVGMEAMITLKGNTVNGKVVQTPKDVPFEIYERDPNLYAKSLLINMEELPEGAEVGSITDIEIITARKNDTLIIPKNGLRSAMGRTYVQVLADNTKRELDVEVGIVSATEVEILRGLNEGDQVILK